MSDFVMMNYSDEKNIFFDRSDVLQLLKRRVIDLKEGYRQNIALLGNRYVGKSSILQNFLLNFDEKEVVNIYLDLENKDFSYLFYKFTCSLLCDYCKSENLTLSDDLKVLSETANTKIPHTVEVLKKIKGDFEKNKIVQCFLGLMTLPEVFTNETGKFCVLILDEFQNLEELVDQKVFQELGKKIMTQKKCLYILSSSYANIAKKILSEKLSLLFGNFEIVNVEPFDLQTSKDFIAHKLSDIRIGSQLKSFLTDFCGGHPFYLNLISQELLNLSAIYKQGEIYLPILSQAVENTIFNRWGVISRHFELIVNELCMGKGNKSVASLMISLSNNHHKVEPLVEDLGCKKSQVVRKLNKLIDLGIVTKNGSSFYYKDKLLKYWIKYVYQKRIRDIELAPDRQRKQFKEEFQRLIENFKAASRKDFQSRIIELLSCFDNDSFSFKGRKYQLPSFRELVPLKVTRENGTTFDMVKAVGEKALWVVVVKKEGLVESDITDLLVEVKRMGKRPNRCLIVSLSSLEENTRLRALQERFWVWNERELNTLLTFFDKPYIL